MNRELHVRQKWYYLTTSMSFWIMLSDQQMSRITPDLPCTACMPHKTTYIERENVRELPKVNIVPMQHVQHTNNCQAHSHFQWKRWHWTWLKLAIGRISSAVLSHHNFKKAKNPNSTLVHIVRMDPLFICYLLV